MDDPDVILGVDPEADDLAEHPVVRQRLGPQRIDLEPRRLERAAILRAGRRSSRWPATPSADDRRQRTPTRSADPVSLIIRLTNFCRRLPSKFSPV